MKTIEQLNSDLIKANARIHDLGLAIHRLDSNIDKLYELIKNGRKITHINAKSPFIGPSESGASKAYRATLGSPFM